MNVMKHTSQQTAISAIMWHHVTVKLEQHMSQKPDVDLDLWVFSKQFPTDLPHSQDDTHSIVLAYSGNFTDLFISFLGSVK